MIQHISDQKEALIKALSVLVFILIICVVVLLWAGRTRDSEVAVNVCSFVGLSKPVEEVQLYSPPVQASLPKVVAVELWSEN